MKAKKLIEDLFGSRVGRLKSFDPGQEPAYTTEQEGSSSPAIRLCEHIIAMEDDDYLTGHPEWGEIVEQAKTVLFILRDLKGGRY